MNKNGKKLWYTTKMEGYLNFLYIEVRQNTHFQKRWINE